MFNNVLSETRRIPKQTNTVFEDFLTDTLDQGCRAAVSVAEKAFTRLEVEAEQILTDLICQLRSSPNARSLGRQEISISKRSRDQLLRYFVFLRYRNSDQYQSTVDGIRCASRGHHPGVNACDGLSCVRRRAILSGYHTFLHHESSDTRNSHRFEDLDCWKFCQAEICLGVAAEGCQYVLPDTCFTSLDEDFGSNPYISFLLPVAVTLIHAT